jgi:hypothetical protein
MQGNLMPVLLKANKRMKSSLWRLSCLFIRCEDGLSVSLVPLLHCYVHWLLEWPEGFQSSVVHMRGLDDAYSQVTRAFKCFVISLSALWGVLAMSKQGVVIPQYDCRCRYNINTAL